MSKLDIVFSNDLVFDLDSSSGFDRPQETIIDIQINQGPLPKGHSQESVLIKPSRNLLAFSVPSEESRDYISRLIAKANGESDFGRCLEKMPVVMQLTAVEKEVVLGLIQDKPYAERILELVVPLLYSSSGEEVAQVMKKVFLSSFESDPVACALAGAWLLREGNSIDVHRMVFSFAEKGEYVESWRGTTRAHLLPLFVRGLLHSQDPIAVAIAAVSCDLKVGSYYYQSYLPEQSWQERFIDYVKSKLKLALVGGLEEQSYAIMRRLLQLPTHPAVGSAMIQALASSQRKENDRFLNSQLYAISGWLKGDDLIAGKRKFEIRQALAKRSL